MTGLSQWIAVALAIAVFFFLLALFWLVRGLTRRKEEFLMHRLGVEPEVEKEPAIRIRSAAEEHEGRIAATSAVRSLAAYLERCGFSIQVGRFIAVSAMSCSVVGILAVLVTGSSLSGPVMAAVALLAIYIVVSRRHGKRVQQINDQLPTALEMMIFSLRAGQNLEDAIKTAADEVEQPLSAELQRCHQEYVMGRPIESALQQLRVRWRPVRALTSFVEAVVVLKRTGGNIIEVMETLVENLRAHAAFEARHRALTAEGRTSGMILMLLPLAILVIQTTMAPKQLLSMLADETGRLFLFLAVGLWLLGILWVSHLVRPTRR
jgi:tight adherence protein B